MHIILRGCTRFKGIRQFLPPDDLLPVTSLVIEFAFDNITDMLIARGLPELNRAALTVSDTTLIISLTIPEWCDVLAHAKPDDVYAGLAHELYRALKPLNFIRTFFTVRAEHPQAHLVRHQR